MKREAYEADVQMLIRQNRFLWLSLGGIVTALVLALLVAWAGMGATRTVVTPPKIEKSFWITDNTASGEYIDQMAQWVSYLTLDVTPDNVQYKSELLLKLAHPDYHGALQQKLRVNADKIRRDNAATSFDIRTVRAAPDALAAVLTGQLKVLINGTPVKNEIRHYLARFDLDGGKAQLIQFKQVKNDDVKAALADAALDAETDGSF
ncbi:MAG TPA: type IV conjugative transfer system protein TraE [Thiobacillaceae bacterium]|jgi:conjugal transfer pilus assembly protein TraE|nr:type IV conjugative transfer system protein TraE [Thiobacillaceae bacterium]HNU63609.1 type IV conjugative transfer system protein TraE [Thiobacillaceae bacterium]